MLTISIAAIMNSMPFIITSGYLYSSPGLSLGEVIQSPQTCGSIDIKDQSVWQSVPRSFEYWKKNPHAPSTYMVTPAIASGFVQITCEQRGKDAVIKAIAK